MDDVEYWGRVEMQHYLSRYMKKEVGTHNVRKGTTRLEQIQNWRNNNE